MSIPDSWLIIRTLGQQAWQVVRDNIEVSAGNWPSGPNKVRLEYPANPPQAVIDEMTFWAQEIQQEWAIYVPGVVIKLKWPVPTPPEEVLPPGQNQNPPRPPVIYPKLPPTTPPSTNDRIYYV